METTASRVGPRMMMLLRILHSMGGESPSKAEAYMRLNYHGGSSNRYGSDVMNRLIRAGLVRALPEKGEGNRIPVEITEKGYTHL